MEMPRSTIRRWYNPRQELKIPVQDIERLQFDGTNRLFKCPVGYDHMCDCETKTCAYYAKRDAGLGECTVPFTVAFIMHAPFKN